jgi:hypothetical protein
MPSPAFVDRRLTAEEKELMKAQIMINLVRAWGDLSTLDTASAINLFDHFTWEYWRQLNNTFGEPLSPREAYKCFKTDFADFDLERSMQEQMKRRNELRKKQKARKEPSWRVKMPF